MYSQSNVIWYNAVSIIKITKEKPFSSRGTCLNLSLSMTLALPTLVKSVYHSGMNNFKEKSINELRKIQISQSTSNDMRKLSEFQRTLVCNR